MALLLVFSFAERRNVPRLRERAAACDRFRLDEQSDISVEGLHVHPGNVLVEVAYPDSLEHLEHVLQEADPAKQDVVALIVHTFSAAAGRANTHSNLRKCVPVAKPIC